MLLFAEGPGLAPIGGVLLPFIPARLVLDPEIEGTEGRGGDPAGNGGDFPPKIEFRVEDDLLRGMNAEGSVVVVPSWERESLLLECD